MGKVKFLAVLMIAAAAAVLSRPAARTKLLDQLFGTEQEFEYTGTSNAADPTATPE